MKNIILFYQVINREKESCERLKKKLEKNSNIKVHIFSIDFENDIAMSLSNKCKIDVIVMPWMYQDLNYYLMQPYIKNNPEIFIINLHHEQIASQASLKRTLPSGEHSKNSVIHFVWGEYFKEALVQEGVKENFIFVTGNMRTDVVGSIEVSKNDIANEFGLSTDKKWILFSENRGWVLNNNSKKDLDLLRAGYSKQDINDHKRIALESLEASIEQFKNLDDTFYNKYELIYRPHPGTPAPLEIPKKIKIIDKYPIQTWLQVIDCNVVWSSTTIFESDVLKVPSFVYEPIPNLSRHKTFGLEKYPTITNLNEITDDLIQFYQKEIASKKNYERYIGPVDNNSTKRVAEAILFILKNGVENYNAKEINNNKFLEFKQIAFQKVTRIMVKLNLLEYFKFPKSAYELRKDIPYSKNNK